MLVFREPKGVRSILLFALLEVYGKGKRPPFTLQVVTVLDIEGFKAGRNSALSAQFPHFLTVHTLAILWEDGTRAGRCTRRINWHRVQGRAG